MARKMEYVYFITGAVVPLIKIGTTVDVARRMSDLQIGSPDLLKLLLAAPGGHAVENSLHHLFYRYRHHGEWFRPAMEIHSFIEDCRAIRDGRISLKPLCGATMLQLIECYGRRQADIASLLRSPLFPTKQLRRRIIDLLRPLSGEPLSLNGAHHWAHFAGRDPIVRPPSLAA